MSPQGSTEPYQHAVEQLIGLLYADTPLNVVQQRACEIARDSLGAECAFLGIGTDGKATVDAAACAPDAGDSAPQSLLDGAMVSRRPVFNEAGVAEVAVPIQYGDRVVGALCATDSRRQRFFESDADALDAFGRYIALARSNHAKVRQWIYELNRERRAIALLVMVAIIVSTALALYAWLFAGENHERVLSNARLAADISTDHLDRYVATGTQIAASAAAVAPTLRGDRARTERFLRTLLASTPSDVIYGMGLWFRPYAFAPHVRLFGPYVHRTHSGHLILTYVWSRTAYNYVTHAWYRLGLHARVHTAVTQPYFDTDHVYISAVHDIRARGASIGVSSVDTTSDAINRFLARISHPQHVTYLTTYDGRIAAFPQPVQLLQFARKRHPAKILLDVTAEDAAAFIARIYPGNRTITRTRPSSIPIVLVNSWASWALGSSAVPVQLVGGGAALTWLLCAAGIVALRRSRSHARAALDIDRERLRLSLEIDTRVQAERALRAAADADPLTALANRNAILGQINDSIAAARSGDRHDALLYVDLSGFERINDSFGHDIGDGVLVTVASLLRRCCAPDDLGARVGGDEFAALVRHGGVEGARRSAERLQQEMAAPMNVGEATVFVDAGMGIAEITGDYTRAEDVVRDAEYAMYHAKRSERATVVIFDPALREAAAEQRELQAALRGALERGEITIAYQPIYRIADRSLVGFEALSRWQRPGAEVMLPGEFIPLAERRGIVLNLDRYVTLTACKQVAEWQGSFPELRLAVNASALHFEHEGAVRELLQVLRNCETRPHTLDVEITESALMRLTPSAIETVRELRKTGVRIHMDDFGTGYSSLSYLQHLHADALKIDRSFVVAMLQDERAMQIVNAILHLASSLRVETIAEGIETEAQTRALAHLGVTMGQGNFFSPPMAPEEAWRLIRS